jgi:eukaryotic translation initiation factor 2C
MELCRVPPGQLIRKQMSPDHIRSILGFSGLPPHERERRIRDGLGVRSDQGGRPDVLIMCYQVLQYGQSQYVREFGISVPNPGLVELDARIIKAPTLKYNPTSKQPNVVCT